MKISASIYSNPSQALEATVSQLDQIHVDFFHVDCLEKPDVFEDIQAIRHISNIPIDLHVISDSPEYYAQKLSEVPVEYVSFQIENLPSNFKLPQQTGAQLGIAILNKTPLDEVERFIDKISFILIMTTIPGVSGGNFDENTYTRIKEIQNRFPTKRIHVDGGVNDEVAKKLSQLGVHCSVSGSYLVKSEIMHKSLLNLKNDIHKLNFPILDASLKPNEVPVLSREGLTLESLLTSMNKKHQAFAIIIDQDYRIDSIVTDGDIRRQLLSKVSDLNAFSVDECLNQGPFLAHDDEILSECMERASSLKQKISFIPVIEKNTKKFSGVVSLLEIFRGK